MDSPNRLVRYMSFIIARMMPRDRCPHCKKSTHWHLSIWKKYTRCLECGQNPLRPSSETK